MKIQSDVRLEDAQLVIDSAITNDGGAMIYLLHRSLHGGEPEAYVRLAEEGTAEISVGTTPIDPARLPRGMTVTFPSRSAGDPIAPAATMTLRTRLPLPLAEAPVAAGAAAATEEASVARLVLVFRYAVPPSSWQPPAAPGVRGLWERLSRPGRRPRPTPGGGFDLHGAETAEVRVALALPRAIGVRRSVAR